MSDLDRALDDRMTAYRPAAVPLYDVVRRRRPRLARSRPGHRRRRPVGRAGGAADEFLRRPEGRRVDLRRGRAACLSGHGAAAVPLPGTLPGIYQVSTSGAQTAAVRNCLASVPGAVVDGLSSEPVPVAAATICRSPDEPCQSFGSSEEAELRQVFAGATAVPSGRVRCALSFSYTVALERPGDATTWSVPIDSCNFVSRGAVPVRLPGNPLPLVRRLFEQARTGTSRDAFVQRCGSEHAPLAPQYVGRREQTLARSVRIVGLDGTCLPHTKDLRRGRVDVLLVRGTVVWAGRF